MIKESEGRLGGRGRRRLLAVPFAAQGSFFGMPSGASFAQPDSRALTDDCDLFRQHKVALRGTASLLFRASCFAADP